jgi:regulator of sigma E protease
MLIYLYRILALSIVLGIIVLVHEFGHYIAARLCGVRVDVFSIGFGKRLFGKKVGATDFRVSLVPLGGYVKMAGEEDYEEQDPKPDEFLSKNRAQKIFILVMGAVMNFVLAFVIFTVINMNGVTIEDYKKEIPEVYYVEEGKPADLAGIKKGDVILSINNKKTPTWKKFEFAITTNPNSDLNVEIKRGDQNINTVMKVGTLAEDNLNPAGIRHQIFTRIGELEPSRPAAQAGWQTGDIIRKINGQTVHFFELEPIIDKNIDLPLEVELERDGKLITSTVIPQRGYYLFYNEYANLKDVEKEYKSLVKQYPDINWRIDFKNNSYRIMDSGFINPDQLDLYKDKFTIKERGRLGFAKDYYSPSKFIQYGFFGAMAASVDNLIEQTFAILKIIKKMISGNVSAKSVSGPIEIAKFSQRAMEHGAESLFMLIAFISAQLGLINLFPIPALDGGHLLIYSLEAIIRREFSAKVKTALMNIGFILLLSLMVFIVLNDITKTLPNGWKTLIPFLK